MIGIVHVTDEILAPLRERYGTPAELEWTGDISDREHALATYNPVRTHDVTLFILDPADRIALIRKPQFAEGIWRPPGGGIKQGEDFVAGAVREAVEETGLRVTLDRYLVASTATFLHEPQDVGWRTHVFSARTIGRGACAAGRGGDRGGTLGHPRRARGVTPRPPPGDRLRVLALPRRAARRRA